MSSINTCGDGPVCKAGTNAKCLVSVSSINTCGDGPACRAGTNASVAIKQSGLIIEVYH